LTRSTVWLLDANLLIALTHSAHIHHAEAHTWFAAHPKRRWATCALTQLAFVRLTSNPKVVGSEITPAEAMQALCLAALRDQRLATLDRGLVSFAMGTGLAASVELVSAPSTVQEPAARYAVKRVRSRA